MDKPWEKDYRDCESIESYYPCPLSNCTRHSEDVKIRWTHSGCGGTFRLYDNGSERCEKCGRGDLFCNWNYSCCTDNKNQILDLFKIRNFLGILVKLPENKVSFEFLINIKICLKKQSIDHPEKFVDSNPD